MLIYVRKCPVLLYNISYVVFTTYQYVVHLSFLGVEKVYFLMILAVQTVFVYQ